MGGCWRLIVLVVGEQLLLVADVQLPVVRAFAPAVGERLLLVVGAFALAAVGERPLLVFDAFALAAADAFLPVVGERLPLAVDASALVARAFGLLGGLVLRRLLVAHAWRQLVLLRRGPEPRSRLLAALLAFAPRVVVAQ